MLNIDIHTLSLIFMLTNFVLALVLALHDQKERNIKGYYGWLIGIGLFSAYFLIQFLQNLSTPHIIFDIIKNIFLVASSLLLYIGFLEFFDKRKYLRNILIYLGAYLVITFAFFATGNRIVPEALSSLSIALFSSMTARLLFLQKLPEIANKTKYILFLTFLVYGFIFLAYGILQFISLALPVLSIATIFTKSSCFVISISATMWSFGFISITNQRLIQNIKETKQIYDLTTNTIPDAILISRLRDGQIAKINEGFTTLSGYTNQDVAGKSTLDINIWHEPKDRQKYVILLSEFGMVENLEFKFHLKNGKLLNGLVSAKTIDFKGETHIFSVVRDITPQKKMEEKLRENEEKYRFLTENSGDVIWHINRGYRIDYISSADERIRGFNRTEVIGQPIWKMFKPEGIKLVREKIEHHLEVEQVGNNMNTTRFEIEQRCKNGEWIWTEVTAAPHYIKDGELIGYHGISRDISERKQLLEKLNRLATIDDLTQIPNRRYFMHLADLELKRAKRYHHPLSIILIDFDNLKVINDTHGHLAGDRALMVFSKIVKTLIRDIDVLGRFGGDEFLILLPETDAQQANVVVERIHQVLAASPVIYQDIHFKISISSGIASMEEWTDTIKGLIQKADKALYKDKDKHGKEIFINGD